MRAPFKTKARTGVSRTLALILVLCWLTAIALVTWLTALHQYDLLKDHLIGRADKVLYFSGLESRINYSEAYRAQARADAGWFRSGQLQGIDYSGLANQRTSLGTIRSAVAFSDMHGIFAPAGYWLHGQDASSEADGELHRLVVSLENMTPSADQLSMLRDPTSVRVRGRLENGVIIADSVETGVIYNVPTSPEESDDTWPLWKQVWAAENTDPEAEAYILRSATLVEAPARAAALDGTDLQQLAVDGLSQSYIGHYYLPQDSLLELIVVSTDVLQLDPQLESTAPGMKVCVAALCSPLLAAAYRLRWVYCFLTVGALLLYRWARGRIHDNLVAPVEGVADCMKRDLDYIADEPLGWAEADTVYRGYARHRDTERQLRNRISRLEAALNYAEKAEEIRRHTTSALAHELKTPLAVVHSYAEGLQLGIAGEKTAFYLETILRESEKMDALVMEMLDFSRLESGRVQIARDRVELGALTRGVFEKLAPLAAEKDLTVTLDWESQFPITADEARLTQAVQNYASNAVKYTPEGGRITVALRKDRKEVRLTVWNSAPALSEEALTKVWEPFYRVDESRTARGTGLGLSITKQIVTLHGGTVSVRNMNDGVQFAMTLPV